jgi:hypothetical protein
MPVDIDEGDEEKRVTEEEIEVSKVFRFRENDI